MQLHERVDRALKMPNQANYISYNIPEFVVSQRAKSHPVDIAASKSNVVIVFPGKPSMSLEMHSPPSSKQPCNGYPLALSPPPPGYRSTRFHNPAHPNTGPSTCLESC